MIKYEFIYKRDLMEVSEKVSANHSNIPYRIVGTLKEMDLVSYL